MYVGIFPKVYNSRRFKEQYAVFAVGTMTDIVILSGEGFMKETLKTKAGLSFFIDSRNTDL